NTDLFDAATIERMSGHFVSLLEGIVANPSEQIAQLPLLTQPELHQLFVEWNSTQVDYPIDKCIHQLFEEQVERTPQAVAVVFGNEQLSYTQLNTRANQLAHYLRSLGVKSDTLVGLCVERSLEMVVGLLGILKAGGAYVPLDPNYPQERIRFMLNDCGAEVLLTHSQLKDKLAIGDWELGIGDRQTVSQSLKILCLDAGSFANQSTHNPTKQNQPDDLAYVIYTSGSTGQPKGVQLLHKGLSNYLHWAKDYYKVAQGIGSPVQSSFSFDATITSLYLPLVCGCTTILVTEKQELELLADIVQQNNHLSLIKITPSHLEILNQQLNSDTIANRVNTIVLGGEALQAKQIIPWLTHAPNTRLINEYGPTEAVVGCCVYEATQKRNLTGNILIGQPIANARIYILDNHNQPLPVGIPGELCIAGAGLARGYLNRPSATAEKFIELDLFGEQERVYKTGDLALWLPDGNLEYLGRIDNQVKIRGFRIELGEIEAVLSQHDHVQTSCVITREDMTGDKRLVAYVVAHQDLTVTIGELRSFLSSNLPTYMVPHNFVILESLPLTPNGKVDRNALPAPDSREGQEVSFVEPRNSKEEILAQIWAEVLRVEQVGIHDNFFELGGDSILSIQIISRAKQKGLQLILKQLFGNQTVAELATVAGTIKAIEAQQDLVTGALPLTPIQQWLFEQNLQQPHHYNQAFVLSVPSDLKPELLKQALQQLLLHHDALRLRFTQSDYSWQQVHSNPDENIAFSVVYLSALSETEQTAAIEAQADCLQARLNLNENLLQVAFFYLGVDKTARLLIVIHHLVIDGVSWRILLEDLELAYQQLAQGQAIKLPPKTTSFKDWSDKLSEYAQSIALKQQVAYWLKGIGASVVPLPVDHLQGANTVASANTVTVSLNQAETRALLQEVPKAYNTQINDVLLTALVLVVSAWTNCEVVLFNLEGHGREDIIDGVDLSRTVGWFTTIFPVLVELTTTENLAQALKSVKEQLRGIPNKGIGYGLLRYLCADAVIAAQLQALPPAEISFNYLGQFDQLLNTSSWLQQASESAGNSHSLQNNRAHLLDINSVISQQRLHISWTYSTNFHLLTTIENLAQEFVQTLQDLIAHCSSPENGGYTPTDFPLIKLNQQQLDQLLAPFFHESGTTHWRNIEDIYPLCSMQQGMLFESLYAPNSGVYFEQTSCSLSGQLNVAAFEQAWQHVVAKHSILRTGFVWEDLAQPVQVVYRCVDIELQRDHWQHLSPQQQQQQLEQLL
ncbi:MAG: amino acid adenylation domain-containing protein, partial [Rhizonema sp. PD38]|nr:amino acid adenylation domain-containing protein [Rhizonema sp. PD38]